MKTINLINKQKKDKKIQFTTDSKKLCSFLTMSTPEMSAPVDFILSKYSKGKSSPTTETIPKLFEILEIAKEIYVAAPPKIKPELIEGV